MEVGAQHISLEVAGKTILFVVSNFILAWAAQATFPGVRRAVLSLSNGWRGFRIARITNSWAIARYVIKNPHSSLAAGLVQTVQLIFFSMLVLINKEPKSSSLWAQGWYLLWSLYLFSMITASFYQATKWFRIFTDPKDYEQYLYKKLCKLEGLDPEYFDRSARGKITETQGDMNMRFAEEYRAASDKLAVAISTLSSMLEPEELERFERSQALWEQHRDLEGEIAAKVVQGGSMEPTVRYGTLGALTVERLTQVQGLLDGRLGR